MPLRPTCQRLANDSKAMRQSACWGHLDSQPDGRSSTWLGRAGLCSTCPPGDADPLAFCCLAAWPYPSLMPTSACRENPGRHCCRSKKPRRKRGARRTLGFPACRATGALAKSQSCRLAEQIKQITLGDAECFGILGSERRDGKLPGFTVCFVSSPFDCLSVCLSVCMRLCMRRCGCLHVCLGACLFFLFCMFACLFLSAWLDGWLAVCLCMRRRMALFTCLLDCLLVCLSLSLGQSLCFFACFARTRAEERERERERDIAVGIPVAAAASV